MHVYKLNTLDTPMYGNSPNLIVERTPGISSVKAPDPTSALPAAEAPQGDAVGQG